MAMRNLTSRYPIAVDLSDSGVVVAVQLQSARGQATLRSAYAGQADADVAEQTVNEDGQLLRDAVAHPGFKGKSVALVPPTGTVLSYPVRVTPGKNEALETAIVREARDTLDLPLEEAIIDYASVQPDPRGEKDVRLVLVMAASRQSVERYQRMVGEAGGVLEVLESPATALIRSHSAGASLGGNPVVLCNVGQRHTTTVVATTRGIIAHRDVPWGSHLLVDKLVRNLELDGQQRDAGFLLHEYGLQHAVGEESGSEQVDPEAGGEVVSQLLTPLVDSFIHELHSITAYVRSQAAEVVFDAIYLYGEGAAIGGLDAYLGRELNTAVKVVDPLGLVGASGGRSDEHGRYAMALGAGLRRVRWL